MKLHLKLKKPVRVKKILQWAVGGLALLLMQASLAWISVPIPPPIPLPAAPAGLSTPSSVTSGTWTVGWHASAGATSYALWESYGNGAYTKVYSGAGTSFTVSGKTVNGTYNYKVQACTVYGACGSFSSPKSTSLLIQVPSTLTLPATNNNGTYTVSWPAISAYTTFAALQEKVGSGAWVTVHDARSSTSKTFANKTDGTYSYRLYTVIAVCVPSCYGATVVQASKSVTVNLVPTTPGRLRVEGKSAEWDGSFSVKWDASSGAVAFYQLFRKREDYGTTTWKTPAITINAGANITYDQALGDGRYAYAIRACRSSSLCSPMSGWITTTVLKMPSAVSISFSGVESRALTVNWHKPTSGRLTHFNLVGERANYGSANFNPHHTFKLDADTLSNKLTYTADGHYKYLVEACNESGCTSSASKTADIFALPDISGVVLSHTQSSLGDSGFTISWPAAGGRVTQYELEHEGVGWGESLEDKYDVIYSGAELSEYVTVDEGHHQFRLKVSNENGSVHTPALRINLLNRPGQPPGLSFSNSTVTGRDLDGNFHVIWGAATGQVEEYRLQRRSVDYGSFFSHRRPFSQVAVLRADELSYEDKNLANGHYQYRVAACNRVGCGFWSAVKQQDVLKIPAQPTSVQGIPPTTLGRFVLNVTYGPGHISAYQVQQSVDGGKTWTDEESGLGELITIPMQRPAFDKDGNPQENYLFRVLACNISGCSNPSPDSNVVRVLPPGTPKSIFSPDASHPNADDDGQFSVAWEPINVDRITYTLQQRQNGGHWQTLGTKLTTASFAMNHGSEALYEYQVRACHEDLGGCGDDTHPLSVRVAYIPGVPAQPGMSSSYSATRANSTIDGDFTLHWSRPAGTITHYLVHRDGSVLPGEYTGTSADFNEEFDGRYNYQVLACNHSICSAPSVALNIHVLRPPPVPVGFTVPQQSDIDGSFYLCWEAVFGTVNHYELRTNNGPWVSVGNVLEVHQTGLADGNYTFEVRACNVVSCSAASVSQTVEVRTAPGIPPQLEIKGDAGTGEFTVQWGTSSGTVTHYVLQESINANGWAQMQSSAARSIDLKKAVDGLYEYKVAACNDWACSEYTSFAAIRVQIALPNTPPAPIVAVAPGRDTHSDRVAISPGQFRVDEQGAATYTLPITAPAGVAGVTPQLALNYSSQGGNGLLGQGGSIGGLSAITRCKKTLVTDGAPGGINLDTKDAYCLDGVRLVQVGASGSDLEYRTEIDQFAKVVGYGAGQGDPSHFVVWRKDGSISIYGNTGDSRQEAPGTGKGFTWARNKFADNMGNAIHYTYTEHSHGELLVHRVSYAGGDAEVTFTYETRPDVRTHYVAGARFLQKQRLSRVDVVNQRTTLLTYNLSYQTAPNGISQLTTAQACRGGVCLPATQFTWANPSMGVTRAAPVYHSDGFAGGRAADFNGDGINELVWMRLRDSGTPYLHLWVADGARWVNGGFEQRAKHGVSSSWAIVDYNNDGRDDLMYQFGANWYVRLGQNTTAPAWGPPLSVARAGSDAQHNTVVDVDSDGLPDVVYWDGHQIKVQRLELNPSGTTSRPYRFSTPATLAGIPDCSPVCGAVDKMKPMVADFNGDGRVDFFIRQTGFCVEPVYCAYNSWSWKAYVSEGNGYRLYHTLPINVEAALTRLADINGDGLTDVAYRKAGFVWVYHLNTGNGFGPEITLGNFSAPAHAEGSQHSTFLDFDRDGDSDFIYRFAYTWYTRRWNGTTFDSPGVSTGYPFTDGISSSPHYWHSAFVDMNGDGRLESVAGDARDHGTNTTQVTISNSTSVEGVVSKIKSGFDTQTRLTYKPLTDSSVYTRANDANSKRWGASVFDVVAPVWVVARVSSSAPRAGSSPGNVDNHAESAVRYEYAGLKMQAGGRGSLGFAAITSIDEQSRMTTKTTYLQQFPYTGRPHTTEVRDAGNRLISKATNTWGTFAAKDGISRPYLKVAVEDVYATTTTSTVTGHFSVGGLSTRTTTTTTPHAQLGIYGDMQRIVVTTQAGGHTFTKTTDNKYFAPDLNKWHHGRLRVTTVTHNRSDNQSASVQRRSEFTYNSDGLLASETTEPRHALTLTTAYQYDPYGNRTQAKQRGYNGANFGGRSGPTTVDRTSTSQFGHNGRYLTQVQNHFGHKVRQVMHRNEFGAVTEEKDANKVVVRSAYGTFGRAYWQGDDTGAFSHTVYRTCAVVSCPGDAHYRVQTQVAGGGETLTYFDKLGREVRTATRMFDGDYAIVAREYDASGRVKFVSAPFEAYSPTASPQHWTTLTYDDLGRVTQTQHPDSSVSAVLYDGLHTTFVDQAQYRRKETRNGLGELVRAEDHNGGFVAYAYDEQGNLAKSTQGGTGVAAVVSTMSYNLLGHKTGMVDADMGTWSYVYNAFGELVKQTNALGQTTRMAYDALGRMTARADSDGIDAAWIYDVAANGLGRLYREDTRQGNVTPLQRTFAYDVFGRSSGITTQITRGAHTETYNARTTYDQYGRVFQTFDGAEAYSGMEYVYNGNGYVAQVYEAATAGSNQPTTYYRVHEMDVWGNITLLNKGGVTVQRQYDAQTGRLASINSQFYTGAYLQQLNYQWDQVGNLTHKVNGALTETYNYDPLHRLTRVAQNNQITLALNYDDLGNITSKRAYTATGSTDADADVGTYTYQAGTHRLQRAGSDHYTHNANGSIVSGAGRSIGYGVHGKPTTLSRAGRTVHLHYGPNRNRYQRIDNIHQASEQVTHYVGHIERIWRANGEVSTKRYISGEVVVTKTGANSTVHTLLTDHLGSMNVLVDEIGQVVQKQSFDAFGQRRSALDYASLTEYDITRFDTSITTRGYTGHEGLDPVGLVHMNGRVYDPRLGRFISADPFVQAPGNTQSLNRYSYLYNNPLNATDPSGHFVVALGAAIYAGVAGLGAVTTGILVGIGATVDALIQGASLERALLQGLISGVTAGAFAHMTPVEGWGGMGWRESAELGLKFGAVGGISSVLQGGKFGHGFVSAGMNPFVGKALSGPLGSRLGAEGQVFVRIGLAGTLSEATGGKFANGAAYAAFSMAVEGVATGSGPKGEGHLLAEGALADENPADDAHYGPPGLKDEHVKVGADIIDVMEPEVRKAARSLVVSEEEVSIVVHGNTEAVILRNNPVTAEKYFEIRQSRIEAAGCGAIRLYSCNTGNVSSTWAQEFANATGRTVYAPSDFVRIYDNGFHRIHNNGQWRRFDPIKPEPVRSE